MLSVFGDKLLVWPSFAMTKLWLLYTDSSLHVIGRGWSKIMGLGHDFDRPLKSIVDLETTQEQRDRASIL